MTKEEYKKAVKELNKYRKHYYGLDSEKGKPGSAPSTPLVSDAIYDELYERVRQWEKSHPEFIDKESPTQGLKEASLRGFEKREHKTRMWGLENVYDSNDLKEWLERLKRNLAKLDAS